MGEPYGFGTPETSANVTYILQYHIRLTLARTFYFLILDRTCGGGGDATIQLICPLIARELRNKGERKAWDVLDPAIPDFTTLVHILTFPGAGQSINVAFLVRSAFLQITFVLRKVVKDAKHHRIPRVETHRSAFNFTPKGQFENLTSAHVK